MKNLFNNITSEERERILEMHKTATKRGYLMNEQGEGDSETTTFDFTPEIDRILNVLPSMNDEVGGFMNLGLGNETIGLILQCADENYSDTIKQVYQDPKQMGDILYNCINKVSKIEGRNDVNLVTLSKKEDAVKKYGAQFATIMKKLYGLK